MKKATSIRSNHFLKSNKSQTAKKLVRKPFRARWLVFIVIIGAIVSYVAGWWTFDLSNPGSSGVRLSIEARDIVSAGEEMTVAFVINNSEHSSLTNTELSVRWPAGVRIINTSIPAVNSSQSIWNFDDIVSGSSQRVEVTLQIFGEEKDIKQINATLVYQLDNFSSDFFAEGVHDITIGDAVVEVDFDDVGNIPPLTDTDWRFVITPQKEVGNNSFFRLILPANLEVDSDSLEINSDKLEKLTDNNSDFLEYSLADKSVGQASVIKFTGQFKAGSQGKELFTWQFGERSDDGFIVIQEGEFEKFIIGDEAEIKVLFNGEEELQSINWGDIADVTLSVRNITSEDLTNLEWSLSLSQDVINWSAVNSDLNIVNDTNGVIRILPDSNEDLKSLPAGETLEVKLSVPIKATPNNSDSLSGTVRLRILGDGNQEALSFSKTIALIKLAQSVRWHSTAHYFSDEGIQLGSGPLPPIVGQKTNYHIQWNIASIETGADSVVISTTLPSYVSWNNQFDISLGSINYNAASRLVTWTINNIDSYDFSNGELQAGWEVGFVPSSDQAGRVIPLTQISTLSFTNNGNNQQQSQPGLTTNLEGDVYASGKGVVREN